ncbi:uncharacterized protein LOC143236491 [Tachypleus tridentatus]|uniref:uncharacterized protein LOC143236491 n=1 Tax=Tachypleus tridentatus TaxID=6853 RepID=UPI003FCF52B9
MMSEKGAIEPKEGRRSKPNKYTGNMIAGLYDLGDTLGRGHFAVVKLAKHVFTGEQVAVKVIDKTKLDDMSRAHLFQEVRLMKLVQHPNVVRLYDVIDTQTKLYLILEFGNGGDMYDYIMKHDKGIDEETAKTYFQQILHAISYCHKLHVVHRDLKPENVVFFEKLGMVKLTDFGFSNKFCPGQKLETSCGSLAYSAPEILLGDSYDAPKVDVWSLGVILYMLVCGHAPFLEANDSETLTMIMDCKYTIPAHVSDDCKRLISSMLIRDPEKRATLEDIASDLWLNSGNPIQPADYLPLVSREHLSEEDHAYIIQKMVNGNIAIKEEILEALDKNEYNHITATYFLLAERKLRAQRQEKAHQLNMKNFRGDFSPLAITPEVATSNPSPTQEKLDIPQDNLVSPLSPLKSLNTHSYGLYLTPSHFSVSLSSVSQLPLARKCSIVREEEDTVSMTSGGSSSPVKSPPLQNNFHNENIEEEETCLSLVVPEQKTLQMFPVKRTELPLPLEKEVGDSLLVSSCSSTRKEDYPIYYSTKKLKILPSGGHRLHAVKSSPQLLLKNKNEEVLVSAKPSSKSCKSRQTRKQLHCVKQTSRSLLSHAMLHLMGQHHKQHFGNSNKTSSFSEQTNQKQDYQEKTYITDKENTKLNDGKAFENDVINDKYQVRNYRIPSAGLVSKLDVLEITNVVEDDHHNYTYTPEDERIVFRPHSLDKTVFSVDSNDSLDFLSDSQPRLMESVSCGDLYTDYSCNQEVLNSDNITLTEFSGHRNSNGQSNPGQEESSEINSGLINDQNSFPSSWSEISKLSHLQMEERGSRNSNIRGSAKLQQMEYDIKTNIRTQAQLQHVDGSSLDIGRLTKHQQMNISDYHQEDRKVDSECSPKSKGLNLTRLVHSASKQVSTLDINQNGWRKMDRSRHRNRNKQSITDMKMASKCCTIC